MMRSLLKAVGAAALGLALSAVGLQTQQAQAQTSPVWRAEYYNNGTLSGAPTVVRNENQLSLNWGQGSPDAAIPVDGFSARFATDVTLAAGTYRFYALADDKVRVTFNFGSQPLIDTFSTSQVGTTVSGDVTINAGTYHIQVDYQELSDNAYVYVQYANLATNPTGPNFPIGTTGGTTNTVTNTINNGSWTAQYYANNSLTGDPAAIITEPTPSHDFGGGSPLPSIPVDNFSARWTSTQSLTGGSYQISARADDGVRVSINGIQVINAFGGTPNTQQNVTLNLPTGNNVFVVEYQELTGNGFINFTIGQVVQATAVPAQQQPGNPTGATATINAFRLNVRAFPNATSGAVITRVNQNEVYAVTGRLADGSWVQINVNNTSGWVSSRFVTVNNNGNTVPTLNPGNTPTANATQAPATSAITVLAQPYTLNIRSGPGTNFSRIARLPAGQAASLVGRNSSNEWYQINYNGVVGWVSAQYAVVSPANANINGVGVTG